MIRFICSIEANSIVELLYNEPTKKTGGIKQKYPPWRTNIFIFIGDVIFRFVLGFIL